MVINGYGGVGEGEKIHSDEEEAVWCSDNGLLWVLCNK